MKGAGYAIMFCGVMELALAAMLIAHAMGFL